MLNMSNVALNRGLCTKCHINFFPNEDDPLNLGEYINCYNENQDGYYLDNQNKIYKKCYFSCKTCNIGGNKLNHNCLEYNENFLFKATCGHVKHLSNSHLYLLSLLLLLLSYKNPFEQFS